MVILSQSAVLSNHHSIEIVATSSRVKRTDTLHDGVELEVLPKSWLAGLCRAIIKGMASCIYVYVFGPANNNS